MLWIMVDGFGTEAEDREVFDYTSMNDNIVLKPCREKKTIMIGKSKFKGYIEQDDQIILVDDEKLDRAYTAAKAYREGYNAGYNAGYDKGKKAGYDKGKKAAMREIKSQVTGLLFKKEVEE